MTEEELNECAWFKDDKSHFTDIEQGLNFYFTSKESMEDIIDMEIFSYVNYRYLYIFEFFKDQK